MGLESSKHCLKKCKEFLIIAIMNRKIKILCANKTHQEIICHYIEQIQLYIDEITKRDEDFDVFINVLTELVQKSNKDAIFSFLGEDYKENWLNQLPMTIYYAVIGYMHLIEVSLLDLIDTTEKLNNLVSETLEDLDFLEVDNSDSYFKINLN
ncbi:MAG: hypothetical protein CL870_03080 [Cytophagia bacterium]|nr:hypothetical protein [Cytophagia bacterium]